MLDEYDAEPMASSQREKKKWETKSWNYQVTLLSLSGHIFFYEISLSKYN